MDSFSVNSLVSTAFQLIITQFNCITGSIVNCQKNKSFPKTVFIMRDKFGTDKEKVVECIQRLINEIKKT